MGTLLLGVSGSIAAYKAAYLARLLVERRHDVWPLLTRGAERFVGPLTFAALCKHRPVTDLWSASEAGDIGHVELAHRADLVVIAPCTADLIARLAMGRADEPLTAVALATRSPIVIAPAMESGMWSNGITQGHIATLVKQRGVRLVPPESGELASGREGVGRMAEPEVILEQIERLLAPQDLSGRRILVTAGPTREAFDPVRFISNASSGKMGYAVARLARRRGAEVCLVTGPTSLAPPDGVEVVRVTTTAEMLAACLDRLGGTSALVMAAAPVDHRPLEASAKKLKKRDSGTRFDVALEATPDILSSLQARTAERVVVGFAAETHDLESNAKDKLARKDLDLIVANEVGGAEGGFGADHNRVTLYDRDGGTEALALMTKEEVARRILDRVVELLAQRSR